MHNESGLHAHPWAAYSPGPEGPQENRLACSLWHSTLDAKIGNKALHLSGLPLPSAAKAQFRTKPNWASDVMMFLRYYGKRPITYTDIP